MTFSIGTGEGFTVFFSELLHETASGLSLIG